MAIEMSEVSAFEIEWLIPHRGQSVLLDRIIDHDGESTTTGIVVGAKPWLERENGSVAPWLSVEYMAQSIAAHEGILARAEGRELPLGFLVSVLDLQIRCASLQQGEFLEVHTVRVRGRPELGVLSHRCALFRPAVGGAEREALAEGRLSISIPKTHSPAWAKR